LFCIFFSSFLRGDSSAFFLGRFIATNVFGYGEVLHSEAEQNLVGAKRTRHSRVVGCFAALFSHS
jgi:hypothetical protein